MVNLKPRLLPTLVTALGALLLGGCLGGQTGGETGANQESGGTLGGEQCDEDVTALAPDETSSLGFSAADVLALVGESVTTNLIWRDTTPMGAESNVTPGPAELTITVLGSSDSRFVDARPADDPDSGGIEPAALCPDRVDVDVTLTIATSDGVLNETVTVTLHATEAERVELVVPLELSELVGTFDAWPTRSTAELIGLELRSDFEPGGVTGSITGTVEEINGDVATAGMVLFAEWPAQ